MHTPRKDNSAADAAANKALDDGDFEQTFEEEVHRFSHALLEDSGYPTGVMFSFDGASRGNPGAAAYGNCAWWGTWRDNSFHCGGQLLAKGLKIGRHTNNIAEVRGMANATKSLLHFFFWFLETCVKATAKRT